MNAYRMTVVGAVFGALLVVATFWLAISDGERGWLSALFESALYPTVIVYVLADAVWEGVFQAVRYTTGYFLMIVVTTIIGGAAEFAAIGYLVDRIRRSTAS